MPLLCSWLFVPGNRPDRIDKALASGADAVIVDLEDAVGPAGKGAAREVVAGLTAGQPVAGQPRLFVRTNGWATPWLLADLEAAVGPRLAGVLLPKAETAEQIRAVDWIIGQCEARRDLVAGRVELLALVESAAGLLGTTAMVGASPRLSGVAFGAADYALDAHVSGPEGLLFARSLLAASARVGRVEHLIDTPFFAIDDEAGLLADAAQARRLGFSGKLLIHPRQITTVHRAFAPTADEVSEARRLLAAYAAAGGAGAVAIDGRMVDAPLVGKAQRVLAAVRGEV